MGTLRRLVARPSRTLIALLTLALGIGANAAILSLAHAVFLQALPYPEADRLVLVGAARGGEAQPFSYPNYADLRQGLSGGGRAPAFADLAAFAFQPFNVTVESETLYLETELVSAGYFALLGEEPALGRRFTAEEDAAPRGRNVAVLSDGLWRGRFAGRDFEEGIALRVNGEPFEVVGVMPPGFRGLTDRARLWVPITTAATLLEPGFLESRVTGWTEVAGRLSPGVGRAAAAAAAGAVMRRLAKDHPDANRGLELSVRPLREAWFGDLFAKVEGLAASALLVLALAFVNVSSLLWARGVERRRELALRSALGAARFRLVRHLLAEGALLALAAGAAALVLVRWSLDGLLALSPLELRSFVAVGTGPAVVAATLALGLTASLAFGLLPALGATRLDLRRELAEGGGGGSEANLRFDFLVVAEVALAFVLLYGALAGAVRFQRRAGLDLGYRAERLVTMRVNLWGESYRDARARIRAGLLIETGLQDEPETEAVTLVGPYMPGDEDWQTRRITVEDWPGDPAEATAYFETHRVSTKYFETLGVDFLEGRPFQSTDALSGRLVAVVSAAAAERCWPGRSPLGRRLKLGAAGVEAPVVTVVGKVRDLAEGGFGRGSGQPHVYLYMWQFPPSYPPTLNVLARAVREPDEQLLAQLRDKVQAIVPDLPAYDVRTLASRLDSQLSGDRFLVLLLAVFTVLAVVLAAAGTYGLASRRVESRARELGVRLALGCRPAGLFRRTLAQGLGLAVTGCLAGTLLTLIAARALESRLGEGLIEPSLLAGVAASLTALGLAATARPAWRAARVDPMTTLRQE